MKAFKGVAATILMTLAVSQSAQAADSLFDQSVLTIDGTPVTMGQYEGKALLIVNSASQCGFTPQYASLEKLYETYKDRGFEVLAFHNLHRRPIIIELVAGNIHQYAGYLLKIA